MITLAIETSTAHGSVALVEDGATRYCENCSADRGHSSALFGVLQRVLGGVRECDQIVVGIGPGSYSGVRVAIAAAIGLRYGLGAELIGIPSVNAIDTGEYVALHDARRGAFAFTRVRDGEAIDGPRLIGPEEIAGLTTGVRVFVPAPMAGVAHAEIRNPDAMLLAQLAQAGRGVAMRDHLEPLYLRDPHITAAKPVPGFGGRTARPCTS